MQRTPAYSPGNSSDGNCGPGLLHHENSLKPLADFRHSEHIRWIWRSVPPAELSSFRVCLQRREFSEL
jgi:hypothetical protein